MIDCVIHLLLLGGNGYIRFSYVHLTLEEQEPDPGPKHTHFLELSESYILSRPIKGWEFVKSTLTF